MAFVFNQEAKGVMMNNHDKFNIELGKRLRDLRKARGLTQKELAMKLNLSTQQIQKYEAGKNSPSAYKLPNIAKILDCSVARFYSDI